MSDFTIENQPFVEALDWLKYNKKITAAKAGELIGMNESAIYNIRGGRLRVRPKMIQELVSEFPDTQKFFLKKENTSNVSEVEELRIELKQSNEELKAALRQIIEIQDRERELIEKYESLKLEYKLFKEQTGKD